EGIVEFDAKGKLRVFPKAAHSGCLAEREIRIELSGPVHNALTGGPVTCRPIGPDCWRLTNCRLVNPVVQTRRGTARSYEIVVCRPRAKCHRRRSGETIDGAPAAVD